MWCDVNVAISDMVRLKCKICDVEYGVVWMWCPGSVECCTMQDVENYGVM